MSITPLPDRWETRDFPVLLEAARALDDGDHPDHEVIAAATGLSVHQVRRAFAALKSGDYIRDVAPQIPPSAAADMVSALGFTGSYQVLTERGRRAVGIWPNEEAIADRLIWFLEKKIQDAPDPETRTRWARIRDSFAGAGRDFAVEVAAAMATRSLGV